MLTRLHSKKNIQLLFGLVSGILFGILLQKGGLTRYDVIIGQLLLIDFTVLKVMLSAILIGMIGFYFFRSLKIVRLQPKAGSIGMNVFGALFFGVAFALLGYCPGTALGAIGNGSMDALLGGIIGMLLGAGLYSIVYPRFRDTIAEKGSFGELTLPKLFKINHWIMVLFFSLLILSILFSLEHFGL